MTNKESSPVSELVERLRKQYEYDRKHYEADPLHREAADRLTALEAENARLRMTMTECRNLADIGGLRLETAQDACDAIVEAVNRATAPKGGEHE